MFRKLEIENFQGKSGSWDFGPRVLLTGPNESGKTGIGAAIIYGLFGSTLTGGVQSDNLVSKGTKGMRVKVETSALTIERKKTRAGTEIAVNGNSMAAADLERSMLDSGVTFDLFMSVFWPGWLMQQEERRRRELIMSLLPRIDREAALDEITGKPGLATTYGVDLSDLGRAATQTSARIRTLTRTIDQRDGEIMGINRAAKTATESAPVVTVEQAGLALQAADRTWKEMDALSREWDRWDRECEAAKDGLQRHTSERERILKDLSDLGDPACPTCGQKLPAKGPTMDKIRARIKDLQKKLETLDRQFPRETPPEPNEGRPAPEDIERTGRAVSEAGKILARARAAEDAKKWNEDSITKLVSLRDRDEAERADLERIAEALKISGISQRELEAGLGAIKEAAPDLQIITSENLKNGSIRECFCVAWNGIEYEHLSTGARKKVDLMLSRAVDKLSGGKVPAYFVDDADLMDCDFDFPPDRQVFICRVGGDELKSDSQSLRSSLRS